MHIDPAACNEHLPLSFAATTQPVPCTGLPAISSATPRHVSASNVSGVRTWSTSHGGLTSSILGDGGVHIDAAACNEHLPLSFAASTQPLPCTGLPSISSATPRHVSASNGSGVRTWSTSRGGLTSSILGDGGVHIDPAACNEHLPLSFVASTQAQASTRLPAISSATSRHVSASNGSGMRTWSTSHGGLTSSILGDGGVHIDPAACNEHLPLSFAASTQPVPCTGLPAISSATSYHVSASNGSGVRTWSTSRRGPGVGGPGRYRFLKYVT